MYIFLCTNSKSDKRIQIRNAIGYHNNLIVYNYILLVFHFLNIRNWISYIPLTHRIGSYCVLIVILH